MKPYVHTLASRKQAGWEKKVPPPTPYLRRDFASFRWHSSIFQNLVPWLLIDRGVCKVQALSDRNVHSFWREKGKWVIKDPNNRCHQGEKDIFKELINVVIWKKQYFGKLNNLHYFQAASFVWGNGETPSATSFFTLQSFNPSESHYM